MVHDAAPHGLAVMGGAAAAGGPDDLGDAGSLRGLQPLGVVATGGSIVLYLAGTLGVSLAQQVSAEDAHHTTLGQVLGVVVVALQLSHALQHRNQVPHHHLVPGSVGNVAAPSHLIHHEGVYLG